MATATIAFAATNANSISWWRRRDPYVLLPLVIVHAIIAGPAVWGTFSVPSVFPHLHELFMGVLLAQCLLLGIWAALGCLPLLVRWALVSGAFLLGLASFAWAMRQVVNLWVEILDLGLIGAMLVTSFAALLLPLRGLLAWRLDFDPSRHAPLTGRRGQIGFMSIAAFSLAIAAPLTIVRLIQQSLPSVDGNSLLFGVMAVLASISASACPVAYAVLNWRRLPLAFAIAPCWCALVAFAHALFSLLIPDLSFFNDDHAWASDWQEIAAFHTGIAACIIPTFTALHLAGLRLFALQHAYQRLADPRNPRSSAATLPTTTLPKAA
jgi:hypothetical protein